MKISFESGEYIDVSLHEGKVVVAIASRHPSKPRSLIVSSAELTIEQFKQLSLTILQEKDI